MVKVVKKKSFRAKLKVKVCQFFTCFYEGLAFSYESFKDFFRIFLYKIKAFGYYCAPSTIRFKLMTSVKFLKVRKCFYIYPIFRIKRFFFSLARCIKDAKGDAVLYFKEIFLRHWKLTLFAFVVCFGIFLLDYQGTIKFGLVTLARELINSPNQKKLFDLYVSLAGIIGTFLGLYFAAASIIAQTIYAKVNGEIGKLLTSIRLSNIYVKSIIVLMAILLVSIFMMVQGIKLSIWNFYLVAIFSFISLVSFWELASYIFLFFNPANLISQYIYPSIQKNINLATNSSLYKYDANFQNHLCKITNDTFNTYDNIVEFALNQDLLQTNVVIDIINQAFVSMSNYIAIKSKIPTNSYWFPQTYQFKKYTSASFSDIDLSQKTGTGFIPATVHDTMWVEERFIQIINRCLKKLFEKGKYKLYYSVILQVGQYVKWLNAKSKTDEVFFILDKIYNPFSVNFVSNSSDKFYTYIADAYVSIYVDLALSFNTNIKQGIEKITIKKIMKRGFIHNSMNLPNSLKKVMEDLHNRLWFESKVEGNIKTPNWHIRNLLIENSLEFTKQWYQDIISRVSKIICDYSEDEFIKNNPDISVVIFNRVYEFYHKLHNALETSKKAFKNDKSFVLLQNQLDAIKNQLLRLVIKISPYIRPTDGQTPDHLGFVYIILHKELLNIIFEEKTENDDIVGDLLRTMVHVVEAQMQDIGEDVVNLVKSGKPVVFIHNNMNWYSAKIEMFFAELMDLSGYIFLFDDIYENKNLKLQIIPVWEYIIEKLGIKTLISQISSYKRPTLSTAKWSVFDNILQTAASYKISELGLLWGTSHYSFCNQGEKEKPTKQYKTKLLENICHKDSDMWRCPKGHDIFIVLYLLDKCDEAQQKELLKNSETSRVYRDSRDDEAK